MRKTFQYKLYRSKKNKILHQRMNLASNVYNFCIAKYKDYYKKFKIHLSKTHLQKHLTWLKKSSKYEYWNKLGSQAFQDVTDRIEGGYKLFFEERKKGNYNIRPPSFRKKTKYKSFTFKGMVGYKLLEDNKIRIGKHIYKYSKSRKIEGKISTLTIKRDKLGDLYLFFSCLIDHPKEVRTMTGKNAGFDFGLKTFLSPSDNSADIKNPLFFKKAIKEIKKANKNLSSKKKGSKNRKKARLNLARVHKKIANKRKDYHFKLALKLANTYDFLFFEDLSIETMKKKWGRKVSDLGFSNFLSILNHCCQQYGAIFYQIDEFFPSSKLCNICKFKNDELKLKDREWVCPSCKTKHNRDKNAAINILEQGHLALNLESVRPTTPLASLV